MKTRVTGVLCVVSSGSPLGGFSLPLYSGLGLKVQLRIGYIANVGLADMGLTFLFNIVIWLRLCAVFFMGYAYFFLDSY
jgi:hypothetical protein